MHWQELKISDWYYSIRLDKTLGKGYVFPISMPTSPFLPTPPFKKICHIPSALTISPTCITILHSAPIHIFQPHSQPYPPFHPHSGILAHISSGYISRTEEAPPWLGILSENLSELKVSGLTENAAPSLV